VLHYRFSSGLNSEDIKEQIVFAENGIFKWRRSFWGINDLILCMFDDMNELTVIIVLTVVHVHGTVIRDR